MKKIRSNNAVLRSLPGEAMKLRGADDDDTIILDGYAAVFDSKSEVMWDFVEIIRHGAFAKTLRETNDICAFNAHLHQQVLARTPDTLVVEEDEHGLRTEITIEPKITYAMDLVHSIRRKDIRKMSFGFWPIKTRWTITKDDEPDLCEILEAALFDVSPVAFPAYPATNIGEREFEIEGMTRRAALGDTRAAANLSRYVLEQKDNEPGAHSDEPTDRHSQSPILYNRVIEIRRRNLILCSEVTKC